MKVGSYFVDLDKLLALFAWLERGFFSVFFGDVRNVSAENPKS